MMSLGLCTSKTKIHALGRVRRSVPGGDKATSTVALVGAHWRRLSTAPLRQLLWRLRSRWRHATRPRRARARFGYDPESYLQNFDDGFPRDDHGRCSTILLLV